MNYKNNDLWIITNNFNISPNKKYKIIPNKLFNLCLDATHRDSWIIPSEDSPSPTKQITLGEFSSSFYFKYKAWPTQFASPIPKLPVEK